jgi:LysM repeat protein
MKLSKVFGIVLSLHVGVILLVMFQPSCQTTGGKAKGLATDESIEPENSKEQTFNQGIEDSEVLDSPEIEPLESINDLATPSRPAPGELIVPKEPGEVSRKSILIPQEQKISPLDLRPADLAIYKVERGDTLWGIARKNGVSLMQLLKANPNLDQSGRLSIGQEIMIPGDRTLQSSEAIMSEAENNNQSDSSEGFYIVSKGDTLSYIARRQGVRLSQLLKANNMSMSSIIRPGQRLSIPSGVSSFVPSQPEDSIIPKMVPLGASTHVIRKGENLSRISSIYGVSVAQIMEWNGLSNPSLIRAGQSIIVSHRTDEIDEAVTSPDNLGNEVENTPVEDGGSLQDFFNDSSNEDRPIIDAP